MASAEFLVSVRSVPDGFVATCQQASTTQGGRVRVDPDLVAEGKASTFNGAMISAMSQLLLGRRVPDAS